MALSSQAQKQLFILGSFVVLLLAVLLYWRINGLVNSYRQIDHAKKIELALQHTQSYLTDGEASQRGFLLTGDSSFLEQYHESPKLVERSLIYVRNLVHENSTQVQNLVALESLIKYRFLLMELSLNNRQASADTLSQYVMRGKASMDRIKFYINRMTLTESTALIQRENQKNKYVRLTPLSLLVLVFAMLTIIGFSYYGITKQLQQSRRNAEDLDYLNRELILKNKQLENSVEELNAFNYIASHDLKEPLRKILFFTDVLETKQGQLDDDGRQFIFKIHTAGERMKRLMDDLLTYAKASITERKMEVVDLNETVTTVIETLSESIREKKAHIFYDRLPHIEAVASQMQQLFENLISNAIKYSKADSAPVINIKSSTVSRGQLPASFEATHQWYHCILFSDNGIGFSQENAEKIFVLFQRLHQRHEFSGTGIGLTICRKIVQNHNGYITAQGELDKGTTFFIYLPA